MLSFARQGDVIVVTELSRIGRSLTDFLGIMNELKSKGVGFIALGEHIDTSSSQGDFIMKLFALLAEYERALILERQRDGIAIAKKNGKYHGRSESKAPENLLSYVERCKNGEISVTAACKKMGISRSTYYRKIERIKQCDKEAEAELYSELNGKIKVFENHEEI